MKGIKVLIFRHDDTKYFYMGMHSDLHIFLDLHQGGMSVTEYHEQWTANKDLAEEYGYKVGESDGTTNQEYEVIGIRMPDTKYDKKRADASEFARGNSLRLHSSLRRTDANTGV